MEKISTFKLLINQQQLNIIVEGLTNLPWKTAHPVLAELDKQINHQKNSQTEVK